ncbi:MAG TPA: hypothetical protein VLD38_01580 [Nitrosopumilaceae archaeon]|nr:hypothetical protein [Nitrosopumilaceae archaeon]
MSVKKPGMLLVIGGFLILFGIGLSFYGSQLIIENLTTQEKRLGIGTSMELTKELDPSINENGVFVVQTDDFREASRLQASVYDSLGQIVILKSIEHSPFQDNFTISTTGVYKLLIENIGERELEVTAVIGYLPNGQSLTVSIFGFIVIIVGLIGLGTGIVYHFKSRGRIGTN